MTQNTSQPLPKMLMNMDIPFANGFDGLFGRMMRETVTMQAEMLEFMNKRMNANMQASQEIWTTKSPVEASEVIQRYYERALEDYMARTNDMIEAAAAIARDVHVPHEWRGRDPKTGKSDKSLNTD